MVSADVPYCSESPFWEQTLQEMNELFETIDLDGSGSLNLYEVVLYLKATCDDISGDNIDKIFANLDTTGDKKVDLAEFKVERSHEYEDLI